MFLKILAFFFSYTSTNGYLYLKGTETLSEKQPGKLSENITKSSENVKKEFLIKSKWAETLGSCFSCHLFYVIFLRNREIAACTPVI